jgi:hypothetical protein
MPQREQDDPRSKCRRVERHGESANARSGVARITRRIRVDARPERELTWIRWNFEETMGRDQNRWASWTSRRQVW